MDDWQLPYNRLRWSDSTCLLCSSDVPLDVRQPFVLGGYRAPPSSTWELLKSVFTLHNETGNMWTHLIPSAYFSLALLDVVMDIAGTGDPAVQAELVWLLLLVGATAYAFLASFSYHLCTCSRKQMRHCTYRMDLSGIVGLIVMSYFSAVAVGYKCWPWLRQFYLVFSGVVSLAVATPMIRPNLVFIDNKTHLILCCVAGLLPAIHWMCIAPLSDILVAGPYIVSMFGAYGVGATFFITRFPESRWPGRFDLLG
eukprot:CAMPEP_0178417008 /NCGR_PEP_ID=MMETSP0689_2-20121128/24356_1 /TAXON_ID=160604 /ORGANISM="Amphidinium massartii, Strain CS-259" /LENGTH=253 /DNA_ID=CAMNT_0020038367 /DNA_START=32 /DNA_END=789 /DNA_ORIENTATION=-